MSKTQSVFFWIFILVMVVATGWSVYRRSLVGAVQHYQIDISDFDIDEVLKNHALKFKLNYGVEVCKGLKVSTEGFVCLEPRSFSTEWPAHCARAIRGICENETFTAGIERFYVRPEQAPALAEKLKTAHAAIGIGLSANGLAQVKDLYLDGVPWLKEK